MIKLMEMVDQNTGISWWDVNRKRLNEVMTAFNEWQVKHRFDSFELEVLTARLKLCREFGDDNNFSDWQYALLDEMEEFISEYLKEKNED